MEKNKEYIYQIYLDGSFSQAAKNLYISQPALSAIVARTERSLHATLFDRSQKPIRPTQAGEYYISCIKRFQAIEQEMSEYFDNLSQGEHGSLAIGSGTFYCTYVLPELIQQFQSLHPAVQVNPVETSSNRGLQMLTRGQLDFSLDVNEIHDCALESTVVAQEHMVLAVPAQLPCNEKLRRYRLTFDEVRRRLHLDDHVPPVDMAAFRDEPFISLKPGNHSHDLLQKLCESAGFTPKVIHYMDQLLTAYYLSNEGSGITVIRDSSLYRVAPSSNHFFYRLPPELSTRNIYLTYRKQEGSRALIQLFVDYMITQSDRFFPSERDSG